MNKTIFYKKVQTGGRPRYEPVYEYDNDLMDAVPIGSSTMITTYKNGTSRKFNIDPAFAPMVAAVMHLNQDITDIIVKAGEYKPAKTPLTKEQIKAWKALNASFGGESIALQGASMHDIAEAILKAISAKAEELLTNEATKASYEQFLTIAALSKK